MTILLCILIAATAVVLSLAFVTTLLMYYETVNSHNEETLRQRAGGSLAYALAMTFLTDVWAQIVVVFTFPLLLSRRYRLPRSKRDALPCASGKDMPVLMVHGLYHNGSAWALFRRRLRVAGYGRFFAYSYNSYFGDFHDLVETLAQAVEHLARMYPDKRIALVGHSLGGLIIRAYLSRPEAPDMVACAVTLGAPFKGSRLAALGVGPLARSLRYDGDLAREVASMPVPPKLPVLSILSPSDNYVTSEDAMHPQGEGTENWEQHIAPPMSHVHLLYSEKVADKAILFLDLTPSGPPVP